MRLDEAYQLLFKDYPDILNVEQVANILNSSPKTVYRLLKNKEIKSITVGRRYCIPTVILLISLFFNNRYTCLLYTSRCV